MARIEDEIVVLEQRAFRPFKSCDEYLYAMKEDLAEWFNILYGVEMTVDNFLDCLETGIILCQHANKIHDLAVNYFQRLGRKHLPFPGRVLYRLDVKAGTFQARDNISNFISWCRAIGIRECLLFETDDLVLRKNEKSFIFCCLEVARIGVQFGMLAPVLVQLEQQIDEEIKQDINLSTNGNYSLNVDRSHYKCRIPRRNSIKSNYDSYDSSDDDIALDSDRPPLRQPSYFDLRHIDEMVKEILMQCTCPDQFPLIRVSDGKYQVGDTQLIIFVRILRNHVMVRVGGGWDTLEHYLEKHDPCRCSALGHKIVKLNQLQTSPFLHPHSGRSVQVVGNLTSDYTPVHVTRSRSKLTCSEGNSSTSSLSESPEPKTSEIVMEDYSCDTESSEETLEIAKLDAGNNLNKLFVKKKHSPENHQTQTINTIYEKAQNILSSSPKVQYPNVKKNSPSISMQHSPEKTKLYQNTPYSSQMSPGEKTLNKSKIPTFYSPKHNAKHKPVETTPQYRRTSLEKCKLLSQNKSKSLENLPIHHLKKEIPLDSQSLTDIDKQKVQNSSKFPHLLHRGKTFSESTSSHGKHPKLESGFTTKSFKSSIPPSSRKLSLTSCSGLHNISSLKPRRGSVSSLLTVLSKESTANDVKINSENLESKSLDKTKSRRVSSPMILQSVKKDNTSQRTSKIPLPYHHNLEAKSHFREQL